MQVLNVSNGCIRCGGLVLTDGSTGERFCQKCGNVIVESIDDSRQERRSFTTDSINNSRTGTPNLLAIHDRGLATVIGGTKDSTGKPISSTMRQDMRRLKIWDSRSQSDNAGRNMRIAFIELGKLRDKLTLPDTVIEKAAYIYRKAAKKGLIRGRSTPNVLAASAYAACRDTGTPRTLVDFSDALNIQKKAVSASYRMLLKELNMKMPIMDSMNCISQIASKLGIDEKVKRYAYDILREANRKEETAGKGPMGLAAASLYMACIKYDLKISQRQISIASGVTEVTIRNRSVSMHKSRSLA
ncbi:MAG: transcription initiation factor IIB [Thaumarchaeota archaeon]|nr:transcription initiation factor IIB [Nitrososphaerota archaeon]NDF48046.1 transcription initiation factor IIB [Nitrosopumilaceae archaeon]